MNISNAIIVTRILRVPKNIQTVVGYEKKVTTLEIVFILLRYKCKSTRELEENEREVAIQMHAVILRKKIE